MIVLCENICNIMGILRVCMQWEREMNDEDLHVKVEVKS